MHQQNATPPLAITRFAPFIIMAEKVLLAAVAVGVILLMAGIDDRFLIYSLPVLGTVFFLRGYIPLPVPENVPADSEDEHRFAQLLALSIVPKVLWIACAVSVAGLTFYLVQTPKESYRQMLLIGGLTIAIGAVMLTYFMATGMKHVRLVTGVLLRALPLAVADFYLLLM